MVGTLLRRISGKPYVCLSLALLVAAAMRLFLLWQYYCISSDGVRYIHAAQDFHAGRITAGLSSVYPPLYPLLIAGLFPFIGDWELTGQVWSILAGVFLLVPLFALLRRIYGDNVAVVGSFLAALAPFLVRYSAHVRTESPFIFLMTVALLVFYSGIRYHLWSRFFYGGLIGGLAYLMRPEAILLLVIIPVVLSIEYGYRKSCDFRAVWLGSALTFVGFLLLSAPYAIHLAGESGDWAAISRKTSYVLWFGFKDTGLVDVEELAAIRDSGSEGLVGFFLKHPFAYLRKALADLLPSLGVYLESIHYSYIPFLILGVFDALRHGFRKREDHLVFVFVSFYLIAFAFLYVNLRYAIQLVPASLGWVAAGMLWCLDEKRLTRLISPKYINLTLGVAVAIFLAGTLGKALQPISPDKAHVRESGNYLKHLSPSGLKVLVFDDRITFYANADPLLLSELQEEGVIQHLRRKDVDYLATELRPWRERFPALAKDPQNYGLELVKEFNAAGKGKILLFRVTRA